MSAHAPSSPAPLRLAFGGALSMAVAFGIGRFVYTPILPHMIADGALTPSSAGLVAGANFLGYLIGALASAASIVQRSPRAFFMWGLVICAASLAFMAGPTSLPLFALTRFIGGAASSFVIVCLSSMVLEPLVRAGRVGLSASPFAGVGFGIAASSILVSLLSAQHFGWRAAWLGNTAMAIVFCVIAWRLLPSQAPAAPTAARADARAGGLSWPLAAIVLSYGLFGFGYVITATFLVAIVRETPSLKAVEPFVWVTVGLAGSLSIIFWSWVARRTTDIAAYWLGCLVEAAGVALSVISPTIPTILAAGVLLGGTFMAITAIGLGVARRLTQMAPQRAQAIMTSAFGFGQIVGPPLAGAMRETTGSFLLPSLIAAGALVASAALGFVVVRADAARR